jgi:hypothetical protein
MMVRIATDKALPFEPLTPKAETVEALKAARRGEVTTVGSPDELLAPTLCWGVPTLSGLRAGASGLTEPRERVEFPATWEVTRKVSIFVFGLLTDADVAWMARAGVRRPIKDQEILIQEGRPLESIIFLLQGE